MTSIANLRTRPTLWVGVFGVEGPKMPLQLPTFQYFDDT